MIHPPVKNRFPRRHQHKRTTLARLSELFAWRAALRLRPDAQQRRNHSPAAETGFAGYFDTWPETEMEVVVFSSPIAPGAYYTYPSLDRSQPGRFFVNVSGGQYAFSMPTLAGCRQNYSVPPG
ncbi:MAG TPA: hypothetical protein VI451_03770 [Anaerolineales bacterium]|nr:hypothetical protein [Anaerolineales bacterium]